MKAIVFDQYGPSSVLRLAELPTPRPQPHQVLVRVKATGVNPGDWGLRKGEMRWVDRGKFPRIVGFESAGVVEEVGELVTHVQPGDRVVALLGHAGGGYATFALTAKERIIKLPDGISFEEGAAVPVTGITALQALRDLAQLRPGDDALVYGASGGVGVMGVQIARILAAHVTAVCSAANAELVRPLGAERVVDYRQVDFAQLPDRYHAVFDAVAKRTFADSKAALRPGGTFVTTRPSPAVLLNMLVLNRFAAKKARFIGAKDRAEDVQWLLDHMVRGPLKAVIDRTYPLLDAKAVAEAHDYSESGRVRGKLVLHVA